MTRAHDRGLVVEDTSPGPHARPLREALALHRARSLHGDGAGYDVKVEPFFVFDGRGPTLEPPLEIGASAPYRRDEREPPARAPVPERVKPRHERHARLDGEHAVHETLATSKRRPRRVSPFANLAPRRKRLRRTKVAKPPRDATQPPPARLRVGPRVPRGVELDVSYPHDRFPEQNPPFAARLDGVRPRVKVVRGVDILPSDQQPMRRLPFRGVTLNSLDPPVKRGRDGGTNHATTQVFGASLRGAPLASSHHRLRPPRERRRRTPVTHTQRASLQHAPQTFPFVHRLAPTLERVGQREPEPAAHDLLHPSEERALVVRVVSPRRKGGVGFGVEQTRDGEPLTPLTAPVRSPVREPSVHLAAAASSLAD